MARVRSGLKRPKNYGVGIRFPRPPHFRGVRGGGLSGARRIRRR